MRVATGFPLLLCMWQRVFRCCSACGNGFSVVALHVATGFPLLLCMWQRVFRCYLKVRKKNNLLFYLMTKL